MELQIPLGVEGPHKVPMSITVEVPESLHALAKGYDINMGHMI